MGLSPAWCCDVSTECRHERSAFVGHGQGYSPALLHVGRGLVLSTVAGHSSRMKGNRGGKMLMWAWYDG